MNSRLAGSPPLLSVLCLTYNHAEFVGKTLEAFHRQATNFDFEIVVSDDASSDDTLAIVESYSERLAGRMRVLRTPINMGVTRNFRRGMKACRGKYIALCEGDDFWRGETKLQVQVDFLESNPEFVMAYHDATIVDSRGEHARSQLPRELQCDASRDDLIGTRPISTLTVCFRNLLGDLPSELDHAPALDLCLWSLLGQHGQGKYLANIEPAGYRTHDGGVFSSQTDASRHMMTAQSLLCLARIYTRQGRSDAGSAVLLKAIRMAGVPLGPAGAAKMLGLALVRCVASSLRAAARRLER
jgi:hypothetical protein